MTREEAEALIARAELWRRTLKQYAHEEGQTEEQTADDLNLAKLIKELLPLVRLGAKVMAPTNEELDTAGGAMWSAKHEDGATRYSAYVRAALSALQEPQP